VLCPLKAIWELSKNLLTPLAGFFACTSMIYKLCAKYSTTCKVTALFLLKSFVQSLACFGLVYPSNAKLLYSCNMHCLHLLVSAKVSSLSAGTPCVIVLLDLLCEGKNLFYMACVAPNSFHKTVVPSLEDFYWTPIFMLKLQLFRLTLF
jgi:hypothetical protein